MVHRLLWFIGDRSYSFLTLGGRPAGLDFLLACLVAGGMAGLLAPLAFSALKSLDEPPTGVDPTLPIRHELTGSVLVGGVCGVAAGALVRLPRAFPHRLTALSGQFKADQTRNAASHGHFRSVDLWIDKQAIRVLDHWAVPHFAQMSHGFPARWPDVWLWCVPAGPAGGYGLAALSRRYLAMLVAGVGRLPLGLSAFLTWCHAAGLLRTAGAAFQFRHRELQEWLTQQASRPATSPPDGS